jgi:methionyl aminopeptidase
MLKFISEEYKTLPFCSRWLVKKFGINALISIRQLEENGNIRNYPVLMESSGGKVSQTEHTVLVESGKVTVTTL